MSELTLFIPSTDAARCADCNGVFYIVGRTTCPGCGSSAFLPLDRGEELVPHLKEIAEERAAENVEGSA